MVRRLFDEAIPERDESKRSTKVHSPKTRPLEENDDTGEPPEKRIMVTIEGSSSSSMKIEQLLLQKKHKIEKLKQEFTRKEQEIEEEFVDKIKKVLEIQETKKKLTKTVAQDNTEDSQSQDEEFMVLDEWKPETRDIPRRVYLSQ